MRTVLLIFFLNIASPAFTQHVGYRSLIFSDSGRRYKPTAVAGERLYYRPVEIDCWYPATTGEGVPMRYGAFLQLFQQRANSFQDDTVYSRLAEETTRYLCAGLGIKNTSALSNYVTESHEKATAASGKFPLIVYMCSYNGMSFENIRLFEALAKRGYFIASVTSVGRYPGNMTTAPADIREQVADGALAINRLKTDVSVDSSRMGIIGYSWGGPGGLLLAQNERVSTVLSLDGSELHYYGQSAKEDSDFNLLRPALSRAAQGTFSYAYLESDGKQSDGPADSIFNILPVLQTAKTYHRYSFATHEDFSCLPAMAASISTTDLARLPDVSGFAVAWFNNQLKNGSNVLPVNSPYPAVKKADGKKISAKVIDEKDRRPLC